MGKITLSLELAEEQHARLLALAAELGCTAARGPKAGQPSVHVLVTDLADGALLARRRKRMQPRRALAGVRVLEEIARDPSATSAVIAERACCSVSLVSKIRSGIR